MSITTYSELQSAAANWLNRADLEQQIPDFIRLAEATLTKVVRSSHLVSSSNISVAVNANSADAPTQMLEPIFLTGSSDGATLEQVSVQQLNWLRKRMSAKGTPRFYAIVGRKVMVAPSPATTTTLTMWYYTEVPALSDAAATNALLTHEPDLYLYTTLLHAAPFLKDDAKTTLFGNLVAQQVATAVQQQKVIQFDSKTPGATLNAPSDVS